MAAYYNESDPFAAQWLRNLIAACHIAPGEVDERSIADVAPDDLRPFRQCHFFAGIGGWSRALRLSGWEDERECWTGSCPCQAFSSATRGRSLRTADSRHLWPAWRRLIAERSPCVVFGEQVAHAGDWFDVVCADMEGMDYAIGAAVLPAVAVGADHARARIYFVCNADGNRESGMSVDAEVDWLSRYRRDAGEVVRTNGAAGRVAILRAIGNAIVPTLAAEFVKAYMEVRP